MSSAVGTVKAGSVLGGVLLIAGSCIGAGMLGLPIITGVGGFVPAMVMFGIAWLFMTLSGLLLLEANLTLGYDLSLVSIAEKTLGKTGKVLTWILFIFLFYSLSIAYIAVSGEIVSSISYDLFGLTIPKAFGSSLFTLIFGVAIYIGTKQVDYLNRLLMVGLVVAYFVLIGLGLPHINLDYIAHSHWKYAFAALPVLVVSFGFQNMIPTLAQYFKGDIKRLRLTICLGSFVPLVFYLLWEFMMLGIIPLKGEEGILNALDKGEAATYALRAVVGQSWINIVASAFALLAIVTSFLAQSLSLVDFLSDGLKIPKIRWGRVFLVALTLIPPFVFAYLYPRIFLTALNMAGGFSAVILFGVMPALMIWILRFKKKVKVPNVLPASRLLLVIILVVALGIFAIELAKELGYSLIPEDLGSLP